jgi:hypothetical protein
MTKMSLIRCSRSIALVLCIVGIITATGAVSALTISADGVPSESAVGEEVSVTYTIEDPFDETGQWTLEGETELTNVSWTVTVLRAGSRVNQNTYGTQSFAQGLDITNNGDEITVELAGTTPEVSNYTYEPEEEYTVASLNRVAGNNEDEIRNDSAHHYTDQSREARTAIEDAQSAIDAAGGHNNAESLVDSAISSYETGNFQNAIDLATQAANDADSDRQTQMLLMAGGGIVVLLLLVGGGYYLYSQRSGNEYSKL